MEGVFSAWSGVFGVPSVFTRLGASPLSSLPDTRTNRLAIQRAKERVARKSSLLAQKTAKEATSPKPLDTSESPNMNTPCSGVPPAHGRGKGSKPREGHEHEDRVDGPQRGDDRPNRDVHGERGRREREHDGYPDGREHGEQHDVEGAAAGVRAGDGARDGRGLRGDLRRDLVDRTQVGHRFGLGKAVFHAVADGLVVERERLLDFGVRQLAQRRSSSDRNSCLVIVVHLALQSHRST